MISTIGDGSGTRFLMAWEVWWALVLGFAISAIVQAWVPRERIEARARRRRARGRSPARPASAPPRRRAPTRRSRSPSRCSRRAPRPRRALAFQFASTNLVWELGPRAVGPDRLAVHARRVRRRHRDDRADGGCCCGCSSRARLEERRARARRRRPTPATSTTRPARELPLARAPDLGAGLVGRRAQLPRRLADALEGDRASASCSPASSRCSATTSSTRSSSTDAPRGRADDRERDRRPA